MYLLKYSLLFHNISSGYPFSLWYLFKYSLLFENINCRHPFLLWYLLKYSLLFDNINCRHPFLLWYSLKYSLSFDDINCRHSFLLWYFHCFKGAIKMVNSVNGSVFISQDCLQPSTLSRGICLLKKIEGHCAYSKASSFFKKVPVYSIEL